MAQLRAHRHRLIGLGLSLWGSLTVVQAGAYTLLHNFNCQTDGCNPVAPGVLVEGGASREAACGARAEALIFHRARVFAGPGSAAPRQR